MPVTSLTLIPNVAASIALFSSLTYSGPMSMSVKLKAQVGPGCSERVAD